MSIVTDDVRLCRRLHCLRVGVDCVHLADFKGFSLRPRWVAFGVSAALIAADVLLNAKVAQKLSLFILSWLPQVSGAYIAMFDPNEILDLISVHGKPVSIGSVVFLVLAGTTLILLAKAERSDVSCA